MLQVEFENRLQFPLCEHQAISQAKLITYYRLLNLLSHFKYISFYLLFLACWGYGVKVLDISNPTSPLTLDSYDDNDGGEELCLVEQDGLLYVADNYGVELFNVSNPNSIVEMAERTSDVGAAHDIDVDDEYIYIAQGGGLLILEVGTTPESGSSDFVLYLTIILVVVAVIAVISSVVYFKIFKPRQGIKEEP